MTSLIFGTGGLAKQIFSFDLDPGSCLFYNDTQEELSEIFQGATCIRSRVELEGICRKMEIGGIIAIGGPSNRKRFYELEMQLGIKPQNFISRLASVSERYVEICEGTVIMAHTIVESGTNLGKGVLVNVKASITHDVSVGAFTEIGPGALLLGGCAVGDKSLIGAGAIILPRVKVGNDVIVGAGSVVTGDVPDGAVVKGIPGRW